LGHRPPLRQTEGRQGLSGGKAEVRGFAP